MMLTIEDVLRIVHLSIEAQAAGFQAAELDYVRTDIEVDPLTGKREWFLFDQRGSGRTFSISFSVSTNKLTGQRLALANAHIERRDKSSMSVRDYLRVHRPELLDVMNWKLDNESLEDRSSRLFATLLSLVRGELRPFLKEGAWETVPFDWGPYK